MGAWSPEDDEDDGPDRGRKIAYAMLAVAILFVLGVAVFIGLQSLGGNKQDTITAPTLRGMTEAAARAALARDGLQLGEVQPKADASVAKGRVISQDPGAGEAVEKGGTVDIVVSSGKPDVTIPEVVGSTREEAANLLETAGFKVNEREDASSSEDEGTVTKVRPDEGSKAPAGSTVTIFYSSGLVSVPKVVGQSEDEAAARLRDAGFKVHTVTQRTSDDDPGTVISQVPDPGTRREQGSTVTIVVAREPEPEPEPTPTETETESPEPTPTETETPTPTPSETETPPGPDLPGD